MRYNSKKGAIVAILFAFILIMTFVSFFSKTYVVPVLLLLVDAYLAWMWVDTYYEITGTQLFYKCALVKGYIDIAAIFEIVKNKKMFSGTKASLSTKGLIIKYNKWDDVYLSPENADEFIAALKAVNPDIIVTE